MGNDDTITIDIPDMSTWGSDLTYTTSASDSVFTVTGPTEVFTRYPDLDARSVQEGLGVDVISDLKKLLNDE